MRTGDVTAMNNHDIAIGLCKMLEKEFGKNFLHSPTIFSADAIELGFFVDVMNLLLYLESSDDWHAFSDEVSPFKGKPMKDIPECSKIYEGFLGLLKRDAH